MMVSREKAQVNRKSVIRAEKVQARWYSSPIPLPLMYDVAKQNLKKDRRPDTSMSI